MLNFRSHLKKLNYQAPSAPLPFRSGQAQNMFKRSFFQGLNCLSALPLVAPLTVT